jgi:pimeloyl-ACP methyl ester carboxylesterase
VTGAALPRPSELELQARLVYHGTVVADYALRTALASVMAGAALAGAPRALRRDEVGALAFYAELAEARDAAAVFLPPEPVRIRSEPGRGPGAPGGRVELLRFRSPYEARNPAARRAYAAHENNTTARAQHWRHASGPRPTLVVVHGFGASPAWFNAAFFSLREVFASGWDVLLYTLPFHGSRRGDLAPVNGLDLFTHGMAHFCEAMIHAIHDLRAFVDHLVAAGVPRVGLTGLSLGGYVTALAAAVDDRLDFAVPNAAVTWVPSLMDSWFPANVTTSVLRTLARLDGDELARALAVHSPLTYDPVLPKERLMVVAGLGDRLAPPSQSLMLWEHWRRPALHWFPGSHVIHAGRGAYREAMRGLMG